jgi:tetratricopeptide (TPR) repeat protein
VSERREPSAAAPRGRGARGEGRRGGRGRAARDEPVGGFFDGEPAGWGGPSPWDRPAPPPPPPSTWEQAGPAWAVEPPWVRAQTEEWIPVGGQRFPGDRRMMRRPTARGRAGVPPPPPGARPAPPWQIAGSPVSPGAPRTPPDDPRGRPVAPRDERHTRPVRPAAAGPAPAPRDERRRTAPPWQTPDSSVYPAAPRDERHTRPISPAAAGPATAPAPRDERQRTAPPWQTPDSPVSPAAPRDERHTQPISPPATGAAPSPPWQPDAPVSPAARAAAPEAPTAPAAETPRPRPAPDAWEGLPPAPRLSLGERLRGAPEVPSEEWVSEPAPGEPKPTVGWFAPARPVDPEPAAGEKATPPAPPAFDLRLDFTATKPEPTPAPTPAPETTGTGTEPTTEPTPEPEPDDTTAEAEPEPQPDPPAEASADTVLPVPEGTAAGVATAVRAPTALHPVVAKEQPAESAEEPAEPAEPVDPEKMLATFPWRFHHETLREIVEDADQLRAVRDRLTEKIDKARDNAARARLLSLRAVVSRILGDLGKAQADGKLALAHAEATGELRRIAIAQARLAHVLQWRGDFAEADRLFAEANSPELPDRLRATMHEHAGRSCYDQGRYIEACNHFERALDLRRVDDPDLIARTEVALDAVFAKVAKNGWGPYPRERDEILQVHRAPVPAFNETAQRWGYEPGIPPSYAEVQPFREGVAWVRRPETATWELIDESGELLIGADAGYAGVASFSDGLAWVSRNGKSGWLAIDRANTLVIANEFDDVRPFRRGVAAVRRGGWGAIDKSGRTVVPTQFSAFATALTDGRYVDGFTDEGLAVVDAGGRKGVVDRTGRVVLPPRFADLVIHPVAFLVGSGTGRWGAVDRRGEALIDPVHRSRADVMEEIDRLLADTKPVL